MQRSSGCPANSVWRKVTSLNGHWVGRAVRPQFKPKGDVSARRRSVCGPAYMTPCATRPRWFEGHAFTGPRPLRPPHPSHPPTPLTPNAHRALLTPRCSSPGAEPEGASQPLKDAFKYQSMFKVKSLPYWGRVNTYGGGGYVADLGLSAYTVSHTHTHTHTRAHTHLHAHTHTLFLSRSLSLSLSLSLSRPLSLSLSLERAQ